MNVFFSSDWHYGHKNIVRGVSEWGDKNGQNTRPFDTLEEHNTAIVDAINSVAKAKDIIYFLGDFSFGGIEKIWEFRRQINCNNIHLILGNHDHHIENNRILTIADNSKSDDDYSASMKRLSPITNNWANRVPARELFASVNQKLFKKINGKTMFLDHFAHRVWNKSHHGVWHLYGHSHGTLAPYGLWGGENCLEQKFYKCMDVGVDTNPGFRPYHFDEIAETMKNRIDLKVDHHNENTN